MQPSKRLLRPGLEHTSTDDDHDELIGGGSFGERCADWITNLYGSWLAFWGQAGLLTIWGIVNIATITLVVKIPHFDPYPFTFLNLFLSSEAAFSTTFVLMSQNRAAQRDRAVSEMLTMTTMRNEVQANEVDERLTANLITQQKVISQVKSNALMIQEVLEKQDEILRQLGVLTHAK